MTFYKTKEGYQARQATGVSAARIATDPKFQRTRENNAEFAAGGAAAKSLRDVLRPMILLTYDARMPSRLFSRIMRVIKADTEHDRGERRVLPQNLGLLRNFGFNVAAELNNTLFVKPTLAVDRATGSVQVGVAALLPGTAIAAPEGSTHFQLNLGVATVDFAGLADASLSMASSEEAPLGNVPFAGAQLQASVPAGTTLPIFVLFGITFYQEVNGKYYPLNNGAFNAISIIEIDVA